MRRPEGGASRHEHGTGHLLHPYPAGTAGTVPVQGVHGRFRRPVVSDKTTDPQWLTYRAYAAAQAAGKGSQLDHEWGKAGSLLKPWKLPPEFYALAIRHLRRRVIRHECAAGVWCADVKAHAAEEADLAEWLDELGVAGLRDREVA